MPSFDHRTPPSPPPLDLDAYTEAARRQLYDLAAAHFFAGPLDPDLEEPPRNPEEAGLAVFFAFGRWFSIFRDWLDPEEDASLPPSARWVVSRIVATPGKGAGVDFDEV